MTDLELYRGRKPARAVTRASQDIRVRTSVQRAHDLARAERAAGRISDITRATRHGLSGAAVIALETEMAVEMSPWAQNDLVRVARTGIAGICGEIARLADPFG